MSEIRKSSKLRRKWMRKGLVGSLTIGKSLFAGCTFDLILGLSQESPPTRSPQWKKKSVKKSVKDLNHKFAESSYVDRPIALIDTSLREPEVTLLAAPVVTESSNVVPHVLEPIVNLVVEPIVSPISQSVVNVDTS